MPLDAIRDFLKQESAGGVLLMIAAVLAMLAINTPLSSAYLAFLHLPMGVTLGPLSLSKPLLLWINDGLMAIFFFLVGLEIKREVLIGELSSVKQAALPAIAAIGGMAAPALIYVAFNIDHPENLDGWAIPSATDIAFAIGVLSLLGDRVPSSLKIFLLALAILDDLGAIIVIAMFYTADLSPLSLTLAGIGLVVLVALNLFGVRRLAAYVLIGIFIWVCVLKSGVHATLAGTLVALTVPLRGKGSDAHDEHHSLAEHCIHELHPWVALGIMPIFAFANAGIPLAGLSWSILVDPITLGIALGLFLGKQIGVMATVGLAQVTGISRLPSEATWLQMYGVAILTGIGFTMSLFIGTLAFGDSDQKVAVRTGVMLATVLSSIVGLGVLWLARTANVGVTPSKAHPSST